MWRTDKWEDFVGAEALSKWLERNCAVNRGSSETVWFRSLINTADEWPSLQERMLPGLGVLVAEMRLNEFRACLSSTPPKVTLRAGRYYIWTSEEGTTFESDDLSKALAAFVKKGRSILDLLDAQECCGTPAVAGGAL